jgi:hypothetical protein
VRRFLAWAAAVVLACDLAVVAVRATTGDGAPAASAPGPAGTAEGGSPVLAPGQARLTGRATSLAVDAEQVGTIPAPLQIEAPRGAGGAEITGALVGGRRVTVVWDAGRPLDLTGGPGSGLDPGPAHLEVDGGTATVFLDGAARALLPGTYRTTAPVAYGTGGLATPSDGLTFTADGRTALVTRGGAVVRLAPRTFDLAGPGRLSARGDFSVTTASGTRRATTVVFGPGPFVARVRAVGATLEVEATFQGSLAAV